MVNGLRREPEFEGNQTGKVQPAASCDDDHEDLGRSELSFTLGQATPCAECAYDLRGLGSRGNCPECGVSIRRSLPGAPMFAERPEQDGPLEERVPCVRCGADLHGLRVHGQCDKCGAEVWFSIYGTWLRTTNAIWLRQVRSGIAVLLCSLLSFLALFAVEVAIRAVWDWSAIVSLGRSGAGVNLEKGKLIFTLANLLPAVLGAVGLYRITTRYAALRSRQKDASIRTLLRFVVCVPLLGLTVTAPLPAMGVHPAGVLAHLGVVLSVDIAVVGLIVYMRFLVQRIPDQSIWRRMTIVMWGYAAASAPSYVRGVYLVWMTALYGHVPSPAPFGLAIGILDGCFVMPAKLGLLVWLLVLVARVHHAFTRALAEAG